MDTMIPQLAIVKWVTSQEFHNSGDWLVHQPGLNRPKKVARYQTKEQAEKAISDGIAQGVCLDCLHKVRAGEWPFRCGGHGDHIMYVRLAVSGKNYSRTPDFAPPMPLNPIDGPVITRDWLNADGTTRPMAPDEFNKRFIGHDA